MIWDDKNLVNILRDSGVVVMPTDTLYGIIGRAEDKNVVERIYKIRERNLKKPYIILIGNNSELRKFSIDLSDIQKNILKNYWPGPVSIIFNCLSEKFNYLHRGTNTLAFRVPALKELKDLLLKTGPLIAPSANTEAMPPSTNIAQAKAYFGDLIDLYIDGGEIIGKASRIIKLQEDGSVTVLRE